MRRLLRALMGREWTMRAACAHEVPDLWFPERDGYDSYPAAIAKHICRDECEVRDECLTYALDNDERFGIWGGLTPRQRDALRRGVTR